MGTSYGKTKLLGGGFIAGQIVSFTTTGATVEVPCLGLKRVVATATAIGEPAADEILSINETASDGYIDVPVGGTITLTRTGASKTSGLSVCVMLYGY